MSDKQSQQGSALAVVSVVLAILLVAALGWIFYQSVTNKESAKITPTPPAGEGSKAMYVDFRKDSTNASGVTIRSAEDVTKLTNVGDKLAAYLKQADLGKNTPVMGGETEKFAFTIDRLYGDYAVGTVTPHAAYTVWGPASGSGEIRVIAGTQNSGFSCDDLKAAKVPRQLVDGKCLGPDGETTYEG